MSNLSSVLEYFDLRAPIVDSARGKDSKPTSRRPGAPKQGAWWWNLVLYLLIVAGVIGKFLFDYWQQARPIVGIDFAISFVIGAMVFPVVYKSTDMRPDQPTVLQSFLAFQNGFFWQTLIGGILN